MKATLIVNHFADGAYFEEIYRLISESAARAGIALSLKSSAELMGDECSAPPAPDFALFWDKDIHLARRLERGGWRLFNSARTVELCDNKALTAEALAKASVPMPKTVVAPMTFYNVGYNKTDFVKNACQILGLPVIIKELYGSLGAQVYLARTEEEAITTIKRIGARPFLFQEMIEDSYGVDIRVNVVGGKACASMLRRGKDGDFRSNIGNGGCGEAVTLSAEEERVALFAADAVGADFAGVDILIKKDGTPLVCEVNSNPHFTGTLRYLGVNLADLIFEHIRRKIEL